MSFHLTNKDSSSLKNQFGNSLIAIKDSVQYLCITLDKLNFSFHLKIVEAKISKAVGVLTKLQHVLPKKKTLVNIYSYATIHSYLLCGIPVWGGTFKTYLSNLSTLQNKAIENLTGASYFDHATPSFKHQKF